MIEKMPDVRQRLAHVYQAYKRALLQHKVTQREAARQKDMDDAAHEEARRYGRRIAARLG
jgi:hypothetical protein